MSDPDQPTTALQRVTPGTLERRQRTPWVNLRARAREALERIGDRVRDRLELPSRDEMAELMARVERLDQHLDRIGTRREKSVPAEP